MLGGTEAIIVKKLLDAYYGGDEDKVPLIDYIGSVRASINAKLASQYAVQVTEEATSTTYKFGKTLPPTDEWLETLVGPNIH